MNGAADVRKKNSAVTPPERFSLHSRIRAVNEETVTSSASGRELQFRAERGKEGRERRGQPQPEEPS